MGDAARKALKLKTYAIVDHHVWLSPPGVTFIWAPDDDWKMDAEKLIQRARWLLLILPPGHDIGDGFAWEIEQIVHHALQPRVIIVLPPFDQDINAYQKAVAQTGVILALLTGSGRRADLNTIQADQIRLRIPPNTLFVKFAGRSGPAPWRHPRGIAQTRILHRPRDVGSSARLYRACLMAALQQTANQVSDKSPDPSAVSGGSSPSTRTSCS